MTEEEKIALFDAWIRKELSGDDLDNFKKMLDQSEDFKKDLKAYQDFSEQIKSGEEYGKINRSLRQIHHEIYTKTNKPLLLRPRFLTLISTAAIGLLIITVTPYLLRKTDGETMASEDYQELKFEQNSEEENTEIFVEYDSTEDYRDSIENSSQFESEAIDALDQSIAYSSERDPQGTCFLISSSGYFITAKHLISEQQIVRIQQKELDMAMNTEVIYRDSILDFAILRCSETKSNLFKSVPYRIMKDDPSLGEDVFTLGFPKAEVVYTKGTVSSENGFKSDSLTYEISMPANRGNSGAPLFGDRGNLAGFIVANNSKKQSVTYVVKPSYILQILGNMEGHAINMSSNYSKTSSKRANLIRAFRPFVFEVH